MEHHHIKERSQNKLNVMWDYFIITIHQISPNLNPIEVLWQIVKGKLETSSLKLQLLRNCGSKYGRSGKQ